MPAYKWIREQFTFENDAELKWQIDVKNWNVQRRCVCNRIQAGFGVVEGIVTHARDLHRRQNGVHHEPGPEARELVLDAPVAIEDGTDQGNGTHNDGVGPDQRGKNEIRTHAAKPAMTVDEVSWRLCLRPRRDGRIRPCSRAQLGLLLLQLRRCSNLVQKRLSANFFAGVGPFCFAQGRSALHNSLDADAEHSHRLSYNVNRTGNDYQTTGSGNLPCTIESRRHIIGVFDIDARPPPHSSFPTLTGGCRAWIVGLGNDSVLGIGKQNLRNPTQGLS